MHLSMIPWRVVVSSPIESQLSQRCCDFAAFLLSAMLFFDVGVKMRILWPQLGHQDFRPVFKPRKYTGGQQYTTQVENNPNPTVLGCFVLGSSVDSVVFFQTLQLISIQLQKDFLAICSQSLYVLLADIVCDFIPLCSLQHDLYQIFEISLMFQELIYFQGINSNFLRYC